MAVFVKKTNSVDVRMVITEEKILSNIERVRKLLDPKSKKQIIKLGQDSYFKDLVESITSYLIEYPNKKNFPANVYKEAYLLVEYATEQFNENNLQIENLLKQREENIKTSILLKEAFETVKLKQDFWIDKLDRYEGKFPKTIAEALTIIANDSIKSKEEVKAAEKVLNAKISNLETNLCIEVDIERIEDRIKGLSFVGIEVAEALKTIPSPLKTAFIDLEKENIKRAVDAELKEQKVEVLSSENKVKKEKFLKLEISETPSNEPNEIKNYQVLMKEKAEEFKNQSDETHTINNEVKNKEIEKMCKEEENSENFNQDTKEENKTEKANDEIQENKLNLEEELKKEFDKSIKQEEQKQYKDKETEEYKEEQEQNNIKNNIKNNINSLEKDQANQEKENNEKEISDYEVYINETRVEVKEGIFSKLFKSIKRMFGIKEQGQIPITGYNDSYQLQDQKNDDKQKRLNDTDTMRVATIKFNNVKK